MKRFYNWTHWQGACISVTGYNHESKREPCQDAVAALSVGDRLAIIVADGAGSTRLGGKGARVAVASAYRHLRTRLQTMCIDSWKEDLTETVRHVNDELTALACAQNEIIDEFATTLLVAFIHPSWTATAHLGDGACVVKQDVGSYLAIATPVHGDSTSATYFVTDHDWLQRLVLRADICRAKAVLAFTDGLENEALVELNKPYPPFCDPFLNCINSQNPAMASDSMAEFLRSDALRQRTADDCSLVAFCRKEAT